MFALVDDIERYGEFLPWVARAQVLERKEGERVGRLEMSRGGFNESFTTRNVVSPPNRLEMRLLDGPFRVLEGVWTFQAINDATGQVGSRVNLTLRFEFKSRMMDLLLAPKFATSCDQLVDAFASRAREVYGVGR